MCFKCCIYCLLLEKKHRASVHWVSCFERQAPSRWPRSPWVFFLLQRLVWVWLPSSTRTSPPTAALLRGTPGQQFRLSSPASVQTAGSEKQYSPVAPQWELDLRGHKSMGFRDCLRDARNSMRAETYVCLTCSLLSPYCLGHSLVHNRSSIKTR